MIIQLGADASECLLNTDKILTVTPVDRTGSKVLWVNGSEEVVEMTFDDLAEVPGFHVIETFELGTGRAQDVMVNTNHLITARATPNDGVSFLILGNGASVDGNPFRLRVGMTIPQLAEMLRDQASPAPTM